MISILLPTYNQAKFLPDALAALAAQTYRDYEIIICDDGSTDGTAEWIDEHRRKRPLTLVPVQQWPRFIRHEKNRGTAAAINSAAALARGELMTWVSSDNVMYPNWLSLLVGCIQQKPGLDAVYSGYNRLNLFPDTLKPRPRWVDPGPYLPERLISSLECYFGPSFLVRKEMWLEHRDGLAHDYDWWLRFEERTQAIACVVDDEDEPIPLCDYRMGPWQTGRNRPKELIADAERRQAEAKERRCRTPAANAAT